MRRLLTRLASLFRRRRAERELDAELQYHLDMLLQEHLRAGMSPERARSEALRLFGSVEGVKDDVRDTWLSRLFETFAQDARYGLRTIRRNPGFSTLVVVTMALGIGANTAIFSVVDGVILSPLPFANGDRLVVLAQGQGDPWANSIGFSVQDIVDYRQARSLSDVVEYHEMSFILLGRGEPQRVATGVVSANYFDVLGLRPVAGRTFRASDDAPGAPAVLLLTHEYWEKAFAADPDVVGRVVRMNDRPHTIIGVLPRIPEYPLEVDVFMPTSACPFRSRQATVEDRSARMTSAIAVVREGVRLSKARADLDVLAANLKTLYPKAYPPADFHATLRPLKEEVTTGFKQTLYILLGTAAFVLLIVCASVANLLLARMVRREHELSVRSAVGASSTRLLRQLLTESCLLAGAGGVLGLALGAAAMPLLVSYVSRYTNRAHEIRLDVNVLLFTLVISMLTGLIFGTVPALQARANPSGLRDGMRTVSSRHAIRSLLIVAQVAISFMLLIGAGLTLKSLYYLQQVDPGFRPENIVTFRANMPFDLFPLSMDNHARLKLMTTYWREFEERLHQLPGTHAVGGGGTIPLNEGGDPTPLVKIVRQGQPPRDGLPDVAVHAATPAYFIALGQPLVAGHTFRPDDTFDAPGVAMINEAAARRFWGSADPIGSRIQAYPLDQRWLKVVGVVGDVRQRLDQPAAPEIYVPLQQAPLFGTLWVVHTDRSLKATMASVREIAGRHDRTMALDRFKTLEDVRSSTLTPRRVTASLIGLFALLALIITAAGITGVIAFSVTQRTQEFGVRMALGASRSRVVRLVLREGLLLVGVGLSIGMAGALVLTRLITNLLFDVQPHDALTYLAVAMVLVTVAVLACFVPARRAASVDPMVALRAQ